MMLVFMQSLRQARRLAGFSLEALAQAAGLSASALSELERGRTKRPYPRTIVAIARALQVNPATIRELANGDDDADAHPDPPQPTNE